MYVHFFSRLDEQPYVYMLKDETQPDVVPIIHIHLSRLGIAFKYDMKTNKIISREYADMHIDADQWFGTLTGLKSGLLLSPINIASDGEHNVVGRKFIVPFGQVCIVQPPDRTKHQKVIIERNSSSKPFVHQYFVFIVNDRLRVLQSVDSPTGWLYLALLHAMTSNALPDEYTGMTGMERAFQLLNSAGCWSDQPYNPLCLNILQQIASISPEATYYPEHLTSMVKLEFHSQHLPYALQHFGYYLIAKRLFASSERLNFMHLPHDSAEAKEFFESKNYDERVLIKLYWDYRDSYNPIARLCEHMETEILQNVSIKRYQSTSIVCPIEMCYQRKRLVDRLYHGGKIQLKNSSSLEVFPLSRWVTSEYQLKNTWIGLFKLAHELKTVKTKKVSDTIDRYELLLNFLHYISHSCVTDPYYLQLLRSVLKATDVSFHSVTYPQWIEYENIEDISFRSDRIKLPQKLYHRGRLDAIDEIRVCYNRNSYYDNESLPTWHINTCVINRLFDSWRNNARLKSRIDTIQGILNGIPILELHPLDECHFSKIYCRKVSKTSSHPT